MNRAVIITYKSLLFSTKWAYKILMFIMKPFLGFVDKKLNNNGKYTAQFVNFENTINNFTKK